MNRALWILFFLAIALGLIWEFYPLPNGAKAMERLPLTGDDFYGKDIPITPFEEANLPNVGILKRLYRVGSNNFFITVLDGTHNRHAVHDPRYCFRGEGWEIVDEKPFKTPYGEANLFTLKKNGIERQALAWFTVGNTHFSSPMEYWIRTSLRRLTLGLSGPEPLSVMIQPTDTPKPDWNVLIEKFKPLFSF